MKNSQKTKTTLLGKTTIILLLTALFLILITHYGANYFMLRTYENLEQKEAITDLERLKSLVIERIESLKIKVADRSSRDDTYQFMDDRNENYLAANFNDSVLSGLDINLVAFINQEGGVIFIKLVDSETRESAPVPPELAELIHEDFLNNPYIPEGSASGIERYGNSAIMIASRPILTTRGEGPARGSLVFGRFVDNAFINSLAVSADMYLYLSVLADSAFPPKGNGAAGLSLETPIALQPVDENLLRGVALFADPHGEPAVLLTAQIQRNIYQEGKSTVFTFTAWTVCLILFASFASLLLLDKLVVRRLSRLNGDVIDIHEGIGLSKVCVKGSDELASLGFNINLMLGSINKAEKELESSREELKTSHDILERKVQERTAQLKLENEINKTIFATIPSIVFLADRTGKVLKANGQFYRFVTLEPGSSSIRLSDISDLRHVMADVLDSLSERKPISVEFRRGQNGSSRLFKAEVVPVEDKVLCVISDITESRSKEERMYLTDRLSSVGEMAAGVAHELNNPLTSIVSLAELALEGDSSPEMQDDLRTISGEAQRAGGIIKNLLSFARKHDPIKAPVQLNMVIEDVLKLRAYEHTINNIKVECNLAPELPEVMADYFQMQQVFLNLVLNAEQAMLEALSWRATYEGGTLKITSEQVDDKVKISFADDGPGIAEANLVHIFDPFFTTKEVGKGTGLGLSICYGIVTAHNGRIYARSEPGKGATFVIELPAEGDSLIKEDSYV
jgi:signal transduction histidine kinase